ncbi:aminotransferase class V-fold PLP-dependent enzyme [Paragemmobacter straminiformis]|uniref:Aminotransferase class V-fold PLP-dependent enzyme n=1 Tax=Paragemmobacter straminiformis TaxID=2045119 RepID=A0A842I9H7_9RHOB|nr:aminotransferase class V-fold PLP-dependent enzyme [Gemmobacter straminiformis]MBC2835744.1 aminotransferase class V-fold PLP-dependent enzyme [Gemmobacter straminiformis]
MQDAYFLYHSIGQYPGKTEDLARAMTEFAGVWGAANDAQWGYLLGGRARFIDRWRGIINAPQGTLTTSESVTQSLHMLVTALPPGLLRGKRVLVGADCFPSNHFLLTRLAERMGFSLHTVPFRQGAAHVEDEDFAAAWGPDVGLALLTWVSSTTSHRIDLAALVAHGRSMGSLIGVDITQAAGLLPFDVADPAVDFTISTSLKWMCGTPGAGVLHVAEPLIALCQPELRGWFSQDNPFNWDLDRFAYAPDIRRFDNGTPGCMAALASLPALDWHASADRKAIAAQNRRQTARIIAAADDLSLTLVTPRPEARRGGSVMLRIDPPAPQIVAALRDEGISADSRGQTLRLSPGIVTTDDGVETLCDALRRHLRP